jgi:hypothetical protein
MDLSLCEFIAAIKKDPTAKIENLSIREFYALKAHILVCQICSETVDEIVAKADEMPHVTDGWDITRYN